MKLGMRSFALMMLPAFFATPPAWAQTAVPCCVISAINDSAGVVTAEVKTSGQTFTFKLSNPQATASLYVGEGVYANFTTHQVSLNGKNMVGSILTPLAPAPAAPAKAENSRITENPEDVPITLEALQPALARVIAMEMDDFQPLLDGAAQEESDKWRGGFSFIGRDWTKYYSKVSLPGLDCRILSHDPDSEWHALTWSFGCVREYGNFTERMNSDYEDLVRVVKAATGLPSITSDDRRPGIGILLSVETRPGSHEFQKERRTIFEEGDPIAIPVMPREYVRVSLDGHMLGWSLVLQVGRHYPH